MKREEGTEGQGEDKISYRGCLKLGYEVSFYGGSLLRSLDLPFWPWSNIIVDAHKHTNLNLIVDFPVY